MSPFPDDYLNSRMDRLDDKLDKVAEDIAFIKGKLEGSGAPIIHKEDAGVLGTVTSKNNSFIMAIGSLITTVILALNQLMGATK